MSLEIIIFLFGLFILVDILLVIYIVQKRRKSKKALKVFVKSQWEKIMKISSHEMQILEGDKLIDTLLAKQGFSGTFAEKLKKYEKKYNKKIPSAWEFHKMRNELAHEMEKTVSDQEYTKYMRLCKETIEHFKISVR